MPFPAGRDTLNDNMKDKVGFLQRSVEAGITARAGGTKALARQLTRSINQLSVVATGTDSVMLPPVSAADVGLEIDIINDGAAAAQVFGQGLDTIDAVATATGVALTNATRCKYTLISYAAGVGAWVSQKTVKST